MADPQVDAAASADQNALDGGNYEVIRARLEEQGRELTRRADALNERRKGTFGSTELVVIGNERVRTENNCVPMDIANVNGRMLFGYNVFIGLKRKTSVSDVLALHQFVQNDAGFDLGGVPEEAVFLEDPKFVEEFDQLYTYYEPRLLRLRTTDSKLLAVFQYGETTDKVRVFRWAIDGKRPVYIDNQGEGDHTFPESHDFPWTSTTHDDHVHGAHPHISILDEVFVETIHGDLTVKVENNTASGQGIFTEPVEDKNQSLDDAKYRYAKLGSLLLIEVLPYNERSPRYLVYNSITQQVTRIDAIGSACLQLPEDHGIIFPGGYYLRTGEYKLFDGDVADLEFERVIRSPNGEDVLYVFHREQDGHYLLLTYNLIRKEVINPIHCHGYSLYGDGRMLVFRSTSDEPTRVHPMVVWRTPFVSAEHAADAPSDGSLLSRVGNADLVRCISDAYTLRTSVADQTPSRRVYEELVRSATRMIDAYWWLGEDEVGDLKSVVDDVRRTSELIIDEFEKVVGLQRRAREALAEAEATQEKVFVDLRDVSYHETVEDYLKAMTRVRTQRGHLITLRDVRYIDTARIDELEQACADAFDDVCRATVDFLVRPEAFEPLLGQLAKLLNEIEAVDKAHELDPYRTSLDEVGGGLELLTEVVAGIEVDDPTQRTTILEGTSETLAQLNRVRAVLQSRRKSLLSHEGKAEFAAQFKLFGQTVSSALAMCDTPERCDEAMSRLVLQLEELEGRFSEFDEFLVDLASKREEVVDAIEGRKQTLLDERQRRIGNLAGAAERILAGVERRSRTMEGDDQLNAYFASDPMVLKLRDVAKSLGELGDSVKADEILGKLTRAKQDALRGMRDRADLFADGGNLISLGRHQFSVNTQEFDLTMVPHNEGMSLHLTGTDFYEDVDDEAFEATRPMWGQTVVSEDGQTYRGEYLAASVLWAAENGQEGLSVDALNSAAMTDEGLLQLVRGYAGERYEEGYDRGLHDADAARILEKVLHMRQTGGLLRFPSDARGWAMMFWAFAEHPSKPVWARKARSFVRLRTVLGRRPGALGTLCATLTEAIGAFAERRDLPSPEPGLATLAGEVLVEELAVDHPRFTVSAAAQQLRDRFLQHLDQDASRAAFDDDIRSLDGDLAEQLAIAQAWMAGVVELDAELRPSSHAVFEAVALLLVGRHLDLEENHALTEVAVDGLLGQHARIVDRTMTLRLDEFLGRLGHFVRERIPAYRAYRQLRHDLLERERDELGLEAYKPKVMSAFVRNRLVNEVYLPLVGDNLAKQLGAAGATKRTDLMGLLLLISPPGYGKTTLMEYIANRLGLVFVKVNGPALGHSVHSLDPAEAPNATARQEVQKINLAFEMGNNVMLYLDDIQHTHPELLQKFISLCDAQRKIEGVWRGRTKTYDLRGKKFCVVMAGNPYTESGETFQIPDMLSNRADTYNLGDVLSGKEEIFALSYIENALTSSPTLAPLASRSQADTYRIIRMAQGEQIPTSDLEHGWSGAELEDMKAVFRHLFAVQRVLLAVNGEYIRSASMDDQYRTEPPFKLQGSYRNMNKMAEKIVPAMTDEEVARMIGDHYVGEAQTLTTDAEQNLLKLAALRGAQTDEQRARWEQIIKDFKRVKMMGGGADDPVARVTGTLHGLSEHLEHIGAHLAGGAQLQAKVTAVGEELSGIRQVIAERDTASIDGRVEQVSGELAALRAVLDRPAPQAHPLAEHLAGIERRLQGNEPVEHGLAAVVGQLQEIAGLLTALGDRPVTVATPVPVAAPVAAPMAAAPRVDPAAIERAQGAIARDVRELQEALFAHTEHFLAGGDGALAEYAARDRMLAGTVPVIQDLTKQIAELAGAYLPESARREFMEDLRRYVADAVKEISASPSAPTHGEA